MAERTPQDLASDLFPSDADSPLLLSLTWEDHQKLIMSPRTRSSLVDTLSAQHITSLLSASSYPFPEPLTSPSTPTPDDSQIQLYGDLLLDSPLGENDKMDVTTKSEALIQKPSKRSQSLSNTTGAEPRKRGRPRKIIDARAGENPEERRRVQIRLAQRAYRSRKEASISSLRNRITQLETQLETAVDRMSGSVLSFSEKLVRSGMLAPNTELAAHLRETVQLCLSLTKEVRVKEDHNQETLESASVSSRELSSPPMRHGSQIQHPLLEAPPISSMDPVLGWDSGTPYDMGVGADPHYLDSSKISIMELSAFMERLHFSALYHGYLLLRDASVDIDNLRSFRLCLHLMDRKRLTSYFEACLHAKASQRRLDEWTGVPFIPLGGAGTHYPRKAQSSPTETLPRWTAVEYPVSRFSEDIQRELDGEWFDMGDLEGYLREKRVSIIARPVYSKHKLSSAQAMVHAGKLIHGLLKNGICLGRSPGFRRQDVEKAVRLAIYA